MMVSLYYQFCPRILYFAHELACDLQVHPGSGYSAPLDPLPVFL